MLRSLARHEASGESARGDDGPTRAANSRAAKTRQTFVQADGESRDIDELRGALARRLEMFVGKMSRRWRTPA